MCVRVVVFDGFVLYLLFPSQLRSVLVPQPSQFSSTEIQRVGTAIREEGGRGTC